MNPMTNTRLLRHGFEYREPTSVDEAVSLLAIRGDQARVLAGGTDLVVQMKLERVAPQLLVSVKRIPELAEIAVHDAGVRTGATVSIRDIGADETIRARYAALAEACAAFGSAQIEVMGTIGGNICNASPAADTVPALIALDAEAVIRGPNGERRVPVESFATAPGDTVLRNDEMLIAVDIPAAKTGSGSAFLKIGRVAADIAKVNAAVAIVRDGDRVIDCRIALGSVAPTVVGARRAEAALTVNTFSAKFLSEAARLAVEDATPIDDVRFTASYRREIVRVLVHDGLLSAWDRTGQMTPRAPLSGFVTKLIIARRAEPRNMPNDLRMTVNGQDRSFSVAPNDLLYGVLRDDLELTGAKYGCGIGECGACTVRVDGKPVLSCLTLAASVDGSNVTTVEGLQRPTGELDELQDAFIKHSAFQCGYCTPGILMAARSLLDENPQPTEETIRRYLRGNLCRCTGYQSFVRAILSVGSRDRPNVR